MKRALWMVLAAAMVGALAASAFLYGRHRRFEMVATLAEIAQSEGVWDNQWDKTTEKLGELRAALVRERDPKRRFALQREIANHALYEGDSDLAISTLEDVQREFGNVLPATSIPSGTS